MCVQLWISCCVLYFHLILLCCSISYGISWTSLSHFTVVSLYILYIAWFILRNFYLDVHTANLCHLGVLSKMVSQFIFLYSIRAS
ncbi:hypothetical protein EI94DRAFT_859078 [Lactarius quietus]|nr:hypothetical protein EI94DRAFT_859078 [Lactarius quietus]